MKIYKYNTTQYQQLTNIHIVFLYPQMCLFKNLPTDLVHMVLDFAFGDPHLFWNRVVLQIPYAVAKPRIRLMLRDMMSEVHRRSGGYDTDILIDVFRRYDEPETEEWLYSDREYIELEYNENDDDFYYYQDDD